MKKNLSNIACLACAVVLAALCVAATVMDKDNLTWGLDFAGGARTAVAVQGGGATSAEAERLSSRLTMLGVKGQRVSAGGDTINVDVPAAQDAADAIGVAVQHGVGAFVRLDSVSDAETLAKISSGGTGVTLADGTYSVAVEGSWFESAQVVRTSSTSLTYGVALTLTSDAKAAFAQMTDELKDVQGQVALVVDGEVIAVNSVSEKLDDGQVTIGGLSLSQARKVATLVSSGVEEADLAVSGASELAPTVDAGALTAAAVAAGVVAVVALVALAAWGRAAGAAAWVGWVVSVFVDLGALVTLVVPGGGFVPSVLNFALVAAGTLFSLAAFVALAARVRAGKKARLLCSSWRELGCVALCLALFSLAALFLSGANWSVTGAVLMAAPAWLVGLLLGQLPVLRMTVLVPASAKGQAPAKAAAKTPKKSA